jgi:hypothetical protein
MLFGNSVITGNRPVSVFVLNSPLEIYKGCRDVQKGSISALRRPNGQRSVHIGLFNAQSVRNKAAAVSAWVSDSILRMVALTETWHDGADSRDLIACLPSGFHNVEMARPRSHSNAESTAASHGGIAMIFDHSLLVPRVNLPLFATFESVYAYVQRPCFNAYVIPINRPRSRAPTDAFFTDLSNLFERSAFFRHLQ